MSYGLTPTGWVPKTTDVIKGEIAADQLKDVDATLDQDPDQPLGQFNGINAGKLAEVWEVIGTIYNALDPDRAEDAALDAACALSGTIRGKSTRSTVSCTVNLDAGKTFNPGTMIANVNGQPTIKFRNRDTVVSTSSGNYTAVFESVDLGPISGNSGTLTVITTPVTGWNSITNPLDANLGTNVEDNTTLRVRRRVELTKEGASTLDSLRADVLTVKNVAQCVVLENNTLQTDSAGIPGKSFNVVIYDPLTAANADVAQQIWNSKPSGIQPYGTVQTSVKDSLGASHNVGFDRAVQKNVYISLTVQTDPTKFPSDGSTQIQNALVALGALQLMGQSVGAARFKAEPIYRLIGNAVIGVAGVLDVTAFTLDFVASPVNTANLPIAAREQAVFSTSRIIVTVT